MKSSPVGEVEGESLPEAQRRIVATLTEPFTVEDIVAKLPASLADDENATKKVSANCAYWRKTGKLEFGPDIPGRATTYQRTKDWALA